MDYFWYHIRTILSRSTHIILYIKSIHLIFIIYAITKEGKKFPIGEKKQRSKGGDLGKLSTVYNYSPEIQKCFKKNG